MMQKSYPKKAPAPQADIRRKWEQGTGHEMRFWWTWLSRNQAMVKEMYTSRRMELKDFIKELLRNSPSETLDILEVGPGPLPALGNNWGSRTVRYQAVDALADAYRYLLEYHHITPIIQPIQAMAESLLDVFEEESFDFVYSCNALDHACDPGLAVSNMFRLTRPGGILYIIACINEGECQDYTGLHQWNFDVYHHRVVLWNKERIHFLDDFLGPRGTYIQRFELKKIKDKPAVHLIITKAL